MRREIARSWSSEVAGVRSQELQNGFPHLSMVANSYYLELIQPLIFILPPQAFAFWNSCLTGLPASRIADRGRHLPLGVAF